MSIAAEEPRRPASAVDYREWLEGLIPPASMPYILARLALAGYKQYDAVIFGSLSEEAFLALRQLDDEGTLSPLLGETLKQEVDYIVNDIEEPDRPSQGRSLASTEAAALLLAWAVDHGSIEHRHDPSEGLIG